VEAIGTARSPKVPNTARKPSAVVEVDEVQVAFGHEGLHRADVGAARDAGAETRLRHLRKHPGFDAASFCEEDAGHGLEAEIR
jgi:hypothetical protein